MPENLDELSAPLGLNTAARKRWARLPFTAKRALALLLGLSLVAFGVAGFNKPFLGSEPVVMPKSELSDELRASTTASSKDETGTPPKQVAPSQTVTII